MKTSFFQRLLRTIGSGWTLLLLLLSAAPVVAQHADSCLIGRNQLPYEENFNELSSGSTAMPCWRLFNHGRAQCYVYALAETDSTPYLMFTVYGANDTTVALLPKMEDSLGDLTIQFRVRNYYGQGFLMLGTADEANPFGSFRPITICRPAAAGLWTSYEFDLSAYSGFRERIAFMSQAAPYDWTFLDDVVVRRNSTCPRVMSLRVDSLSSDVLRLVWLDTARSGRYQVQLRGSMAGGGSEVDELVFDTMATFQNLLPNRQYTGRVRSLCADNDSSFWSEVVCMTPCTPMQGSLRETFDSTEVLPPCWQQYQLPGYNPAGNYPMLTTRYASSGTRSLLINSGSTYASYVVLPPMADSIHLLELRLKALRASSYYTGMLRVGVMTIADDTATFHPIDSICPQQAGVWQTIELSLDSYRGAQGRLALMGSTSDGNYVSMAVDDIELYRIPTCRRPLAAEVMAMTDSSVVMRLTPRRRGDRMHFVLSSEAHQQEVSTTDTLIVLSGLQPTTSYRWQLRTLCSTTDSSEDLCGQFTTPCAPVALPWSDHFDGYAVSDTAQLSVCWRKYHTPSFNEQSYPILSQEWSLSGSNALRFFAYGDEECYAVLPKSEVAYDSVMLTFDVLAADAGSQLWVVLLPAPNRIAEHRLLHRINLATANDWQHIEVPLTGEGYVGIYCCARGGRSSFYVDNVELKRRPVCPQWLHKSVYTYADSARLSWSVSPSIAPIQNYHLTLTGGGVTQLFRTSDTSVVLPNLFPRTTYRVTLWNDCDSADAQTIVFTTRCHTDTVEIGGSTTASGSDALPLHLYYNYSASQQLFRSDELGLSATVTAISFHYTGASPATKAHCRIYLDTVSDTVLQAARRTDYGQLVYEGSIEATDGWCTVQFDTTYDYTDSHQLLLTVVDNSASYTGRNLTYTCHEAARRAWVYYSDERPVDSLSAWRAVDLNNDVRFLSCMEDDCMQATVELDTITSSTIQVYVRAGVDSVLFRWREVEGVLPTPTRRAAGELMCLTNLQPATRYELQVGTRCGDDTLWTSITFNTLCRPMQLAANPISTDSCFVSWTAGCASQAAFRVEYRPLHDATAETSVCYAVSPNAWLTALRANCEYEVRVVAVDAEGHSIGEAESTQFITPACEAVIQFMATWTDMGVRLIWNGVPEADCFEVEWGTAGYVEGMGTNIVLCDTAIVLDTLQSDTEYWFYIRHRCDENNRSSWTHTSIVTGQMGVVPKPTNRSRWRVTPSPLPRGAEVHIEGDAVVKQLLIYDMQGRVLLNMMHPDIRRGIRLPRSITRGHYMVCIHGEASSQPQLQILTIR